MSPVLWLIIALLATLCVELSLAYLFFGKKRLLYPVFLCNLLTNPLLNIALMVLLYLGGRRYYTAVLVLLETAVLFIEAWLMRIMPTSLTYKRALFISFCLNGASLLAGFAVQGALRAMGAAL